jgi:hypothetical protein
MALKLRILSLYKKWAISKINHDQLKNKPSNVKINMNEDSEPSGITIHADDFLVAS